MTPFERQFFPLAYTWFACRWRIMQGDAIEDCPIPFILEYDIVGDNDSYYEMQIICAERLARG